MEKLVIVDGESYKDWITEISNEFKRSQIRAAVKINDAHQRINDTQIPLPKQQIIRKLMQKLIQNHHGYRMVVNSCCDVYVVNNNSITFIFYKDKNTDIKYLLGKAIMYRYYLSEYEVKFKTIDNDSLFADILNNR